MRNQQKLATFSKENYEEHPKGNLERNASVPRSQEDFITQVFEEIEGRLTKKMSLGYSRTESRISPALSRLYVFLPNPPIQGHSGTAPGTSRNTLRTNQGTNADDSQSDHHPDTGVSQS